MCKLALAFVSLLLLAAAPASAAGTAPNHWVVTQLSGDARVMHPGAQPASLTVNGELSPGDTLMTGPTGRATLVRGADYIIVAPHSELRLPSAAQPSGFTRVMQNLGTMLFKVQHTAIPHFAVDTPMLAAVVKGTTFTVVVDAHRSAVQVIQGRVQVSAIDGGMSRMVEGGRTVFVNHDRPNVLIDADKPAPATAQPSSTSVNVSAAGDSPFGAIASLTDGLVRADLTPAVSIAANMTAPTAVPLVQASLTSTAPSPTPTTAPTSGSPNTTTVGTGTPVATALSMPSPAIIVASTTTANTSTVIVPGTAPPSASVPSVTSPTVTVANVTVPAVTTPAVTVGSNTGPGSLSSGSGSNSGPGSLNSGSGSSNGGPGSLSSGSGSSNSGPGSLSSGSGSSNSGPGSLTSGSGSVSTGSDPLLAVSTPTVTVPGITTPIIPITTPTVTIPSIDVTVGTAPAPTPVLGLPTIQIGPLKL